jgi:hypothetical protein
MKLTRRYQTLPDRAVCLSPRCPWHREGPDAEATGAAHALYNAGHEVRVCSSAVVIFNGRGPSLADARRAVEASGVSR